MHPAQAAAQLAAMVASYYAELVRLGMERADALHLAAELSKSLVPNPNPPGANA